MSLTPILLFFHISLIFSAVTISFGPALIMRLAERSGQMALVRGVALASKPIGPAIPILFISSGIFGLLTAINVGYNLLAPWLVIAYVLFLVAMITGIGINRTFLLRLAPLVKDARAGPGVVRRTSLPIREHPRLHRHPRPDLRHGGEAVFVDRPAR